MGEIEVLSKLLKVSENDLNQWSDGTWTLRNYPDREYIFTEEETDIYMEFLGEFDGRFLYYN